MPLLSTFVVVALAPVAPIQRPDVVAPAADAASAAPADPSPQAGSTEAPQIAPQVPPTQPPTQPPVATAPVEAPAPTDVAEPPVTETIEDPGLRVAQERSGPPYYDEADEAALRERYTINETGPANREPVRWRCLVADPTCGTNVEVNATSAFALRAQQGDVSEGTVRRWNSGRAQYDLWVNLPILTESRRRVRFTKMTLGPKGGLVFSDTGDFWGNLGIAGRYWLGRGRLSPTIEFTSALAFKLGSRPTRDLGGAEPEFVTQRGPIGFTADVGVGLGGFGALIVGGQYDSPLAREDVPEQYRVSSSGMFFVGFRGNIVWGAPAAAAVVTHGLTQRLAARPVR